MIHYQQGCPRLPQMVIRLGCSPHTLGYNHYLHVNVCVGCKGLANFPGECSVAATLTRDAARKTQATRNLRVLKKKKTRTKKIFKLFFHRMFCFVPVVSFFFWSLVKESDSKSFPNSIRTFDVCSETSFVKISKVVFLNGLDSLNALTHV